MLLLTDVYISAAAAAFGFQLKWSKSTPNGPMTPPRSFLGFASAVVTTECVLHDAAVNVVATTMMLRCV
jgi:hypothetical protein